VSTSRDPVPPSDVIENLPAEERARMREVWAAGIADLEARCAERGETNPGQAVALRHLHRGVATVDRLTNPTSPWTDPSVVFVAARSVNSFDNAHRASKATGRLLTLCQQQHAAVGRWIGLGEWVGLAEADSVFAALKQAHELIERALAAGLPETDGAES
jgi:hypothetical protein